MSEGNKPELLATGFAPHIQELHEFFRTRGVAFGKPEELKPFVERIRNDEGFRREMASMVRAIIYRERDGLMPIKLLELMVAAVTGARVDAPGQDQDAVRQMTGFVGGVFRSRWNPGGSVTATDDKAVDAAVADAMTSGAATADAAASTQVDAVARPMTPIFYQAQVVAKGGEDPAFNETVADAEPVIAKKTKAAKAREAAKAEENVLPLRGKSEAAGAPFLSLAGYAARADPVVAFLRGEGTADGAPAGLGRRRSGGWMWVAMILAVVVAFSAGMYTRQWMLTHSIQAWPWHRQAMPIVSSGAVAPSTSTTVPVNSGAVQPPAQGGKAAQPRRPAQVEAARSEWKGGAESATDMYEPGSGVPAKNAAGNGAANARRGDLGAASPALSSAVGSAAGSTDGATAQPMTGGSKPSLEGDVARSGDARATAMLGASPELMGSHLLFAPELQYPERARIAHIQGTVVVEALVGSDGSVVRAHAISGQRLLRAAAEREVDARRYQPYVVNDIPMAVRTLVTVDFRLP